MVRAPPRVPPRSLALSGVLGWGRSGPGSPLPGCCCEGRLRSGAPPPLTARPLGGLLGSATHVLWARVCGCGGPTLSPWPACPLGAACRGGGVVGGRPWGGSACHCCEGRPLGGLLGPTTHWLWVRGAAGPGDPSPTPQSALLRAGFARCGGGTRAPGGGRLLPGCGASGVGRSPTPECPPSGQAAGAHYPLAVGVGGCGRGDPLPTPRARSCVLWGQHEGARGGRPLPGCGASGVGRSPSPDCPPSGRAAGAHYPLAVGAGGCGRGDPSPTPQRALLRAGFARCGGGMRALGGGASCLGVGRLGSGALPPPTARPLGGLLGPTTHWLSVRGGTGVGTCHQPHSARSCELALRAVRAA